MKHPSLDATMPASTKTKTNLAQGSALLKGTFNQSVNGKQVRILKTLQFRKKSYTAGKAETFHLIHTQGFSVTIGDNARVHSFSSVLGE